VTCSVPLAAHVELGAEVVVVVPGSLVAGLVAVVVVVVAVGSAGALVVLDVVPVVVSVVVDVVAVAAIAAETVMPTTKNATTTAAMTVAVLLLLLLLCVFDATRRSLVDVPDRPAPPQAPHAGTVRESLKKPQFVSHLSTQSE